METIRVRTSHREEMVEVTGEVRRAVRESAVDEGVCLVATPHTTCGIAVNEGYDPDVVRDVLAHLRAVVPQDAAFEHAEGNSDSHIKAILVGNSTLLPVADGELRLGRWQAVFLCEFDGPREREVWVSVR